jgi:hypothetical protein
MAKPVIVYFVAFKSTKPRAGIPKSYMRKEGDKRGMKEEEKKQTRRMRRVTNPL